MGPGPAGITQFQQLFLRILGLSVGLGFVALLVMLVIGGMKYLTSGGDQKAVAAARQTLTWAILGMVFFAVAWLALQLVAAITGNNGNNGAINILNINFCFTTNCN